MAVETPEKKPQYRFLGVNSGARKESEKIKDFAVFTLITLARLDAWWHKTRLEGSLPQDGPGIIVGNHSSSRDILRIVEAGRRTAGRWIIGMAKEPLLHPEVQEPKEVTDRTGREDNLPMPLKKVRAWFLRNVGNIVVKRGGRNMEAIREARERLKNGMLVGIFLQETRIKKGDLTKLMNGAAFLASLNPDVPIYPVGFSREKVEIQKGRVRRYLERIKGVILREDYNPSKTKFIDRVRIGEAFTYNDILNDPSLPPINSHEDFTVLLADKISHLLPEDIQAHWKEERLEYEYGKKLKAAEIQISSN